jgi:hypothetical protein
MITAWAAVWLKIMRKKTPQEKKQLSYKKDRRNCYGESPHGARKSIPRRKKLRNRANRKYQEQQLTITGRKLDDDLAEQIETRLYQKAPKVWNKVADDPLKKTVERKQRKGRSWKRRVGAEQQRRKPMIYRSNAQTKSKNRMRRFL